MIRIEPINWGSDRKHESQELAKEGVGDWIDWANASDTLKGEEK